MGRTARFILKLIAAGLALAAFVCLIVGSWNDICEAIEGYRERAFQRREIRDYDDEALYG